MKNNDNFKFEESAPTEHDLKMLIEANSQVLKWYNKVFSTSKTILTVKDLDELYPFIKKGTRWNSKYRNNAILLLGSVIGQIMVDELNFEWIVFKDDIGEELSLVHKASNWRAFPFSSVKKRIRKRDKNYFTPLYKMHAEYILNKLKSE